MKKNITNLLLGAVLFLISCTSDEDLNIAGTVVEYDTATPIADAKIIIIGGVTNGSFEPPNRVFCR